MKRFVMLLLGTFVILSLAACTPTEDRNKTGEVKQTQGAMTGADKLPDQDAPDMIIVSIYVVGEDGQSLSTVMESVLDSEDAYDLEDALMNLLEYYDVLPGWAWVMDYDPGEELGEIIGPGADSGEPTYTGAVLNINCFTEDLEDEMVRKAVALTYMENMNADSITLQIDGDDVVTYTIDELR